MGFRTVVMLSNDQCDRWSTDPELGKKIRRGMNWAGSFSDERYGDHADLGYGRVVECTHADTETLAIVDGYTTFKPIGHSASYGHSTDEEVALRLLKRAAENMGYRLVKKSVKR